jgi:uncharacterized membrane protein YfcA
MSVADCLFLLVIFLSNIIQSITGFAGTVLAMPFSLNLVGAEVAKPVLNLSALVLCLYIAIRYRKAIAWKQFLIMLGVVGAGFGVGFAVENAQIPSEVLLKIYGLSIVFIAVFFMMGDLVKIKIPTAILYVFLFLGGILHKLYVSGGPLVVIYATAKLVDKDKFRSTLSLMWVVLNGLLFAQHLSLGFFTPHVWLLFGLSCVLTLGSYALGKMLYKKIALPEFLKLTYVLLLISGISILL